jgi:hypothetical protein
MDKWIELNVIPTDDSRIDVILSGLVKAYISRLSGSGTRFHWHFFREPDLRWRILASSGAVDTIKAELHASLTTLEKTEPQTYSRHFFGAHGVPNKEYPGEEDSYGDAWELCYKRWEAGSNLALMLCTTRSGERRDFHARRDMHLILNQLGYTRLQEAQLHRVEAENLDS